MITFQVVVLVHILTYIYKDLKKIMKVKEFWKNIRYHKFSQFLKLYKNNNNKKFTIYFTICPIVSFNKI